MRVLCRHDALFAPLLHVVSTASGAAEQSPGGHGRGTTWR